MCADYVTFLPCSMFAIPVSPVTKQFECKRSITKLRPGGGLEVEPGVSDCHVQWVFACTYSSTVVENINVEHDDSTIRWTDESYILNRRLQKKSIIYAEKKPFYAEKKQKKSIIYAEKQALFTHFEAAFFGITFDTTNTSQIFELL